MEEIEEVGDTIVTFPGGVWKTVCQEQSVLILSDDKASESVLSALLHVPNRTTSFNFTGPSVKYTILIVRAYTVG